MRPPGFFQRHSPNPDLPLAPPSRGRKFSNFPRIKALLPDALCTSAPSRQESPQPHANTETSQRMTEREQWMAVAIATLGFTFPTHKTSSTVGEVYPLSLDSPHQLHLALAQTRTRQEGLGTLRPNRKLLGILCQKVHRGLSQAVCWCPCLHMASFRGGKERGRMEVHGREKMDSPIIVSSPSPRREPTIKTNCKAESGGTLF